MCHLHRRARSTSVPWGDEVAPPVEAAEKAEAKADGDCREESQGRLLLRERGSVVCLLKSVRLKRLVSDWTSNPSPVTQR